MNLLEKVRTTIEKFRLLTPGDTVVVGVSGGPDSVALLHLLADLRSGYRLTLHVAHLNHRLRPEATEDAAFVRQLASGLEIPVTVESVDVRALASAEKRSVEAAGRQARYAMYARVAATVGASRIATAHTRDDQVETVAMRLLQESSWEALAGIPEARPLGPAVVVRPLIEAGRAEIVEYLRARQVPWREDPTNRDQRFVRNWVRMTWLPALDAQDPAGRRLLWDLGALTRDADRLLWQTAEGVMAGARRADGAIVLALETLHPLPPDVRRRVIQLAAREIAGTDVTPRDVLQLKACDVVTGRVGRELRLAGCLVRRGYRTVEIAAGGPPAPREYRLSVPGRVDADAFGVVITAEVVERSSVPRVAGGEPDEACLDAAAVGDELIVRPWRHGDRLSPLGLRGSKKVHDIFVDRKVPRWERSRTPLVTDAAGRIVWIVGHAVADPAKVTEATERVVRLRARGVGTTSRIAEAKTAGGALRSGRFGP